jgi:hypothetical protein
MGVDRLGVDDGIGDGAGATDPPGGGVNAGGGAIDVGTGVVGSVVGHGGGGPGFLMSITSHAIAPETQSAVTIRRPSPSSRVPLMLRVQ